MTYMTWNLLLKYVNITLQFPPSASRNTLVSLDCLKGTYDSFLLSALTVCSRKDRLRLMNWASTNV